MGLFIIGSCIIWGERHNVIVLDSSLVNLKVEARQSFSHFPDIKFYIFFQFILNLESQFENFPQQLNLFFCLL